MRCGDYYWAYSQLGLLNFFEVSRSSFGSIAAPEQGSFRGWEQFEQHLDSIEAIAEQLQAFEDAVDERVAARIAVDERVPVEEEEQTATQGETPDYG